jgi:hypothetical protein
MTTGAGGAGSWNGFAEGPHPGVTPRDRSIVALAALIARNQTIEMAYHFNLALDNGVKPREISEIITHLAFSGWASDVGVFNGASIRNFNSLPHFARSQRWVRQVGGDAYRPLYP